MADTVRVGGSKMIGIMMILIGLVGAMICGLVGIIQLIFSGSALLGILLLCFVLMVAGYFSTVFLNL